MKTGKNRKAECMECLKEIIKPGDKIYCNLRHVSRSGMFRAISLHIKTEDGIRDISRPAGDLLEVYNDKYRACGMSGCGMDMGFALVYDLSRAMNQNGFECIGKGCPSNDHSNGDRDYTPHMHSDGGYGLRHEWL